ncbi:hypothetical protein F5141DRAFT_1223693 [Pisolithus sp. B1]|nr:hypothetical protein F5141DRAFT_1223693 [Pisolithus sp. B1]
MPPSHPSFKRCFCGECAEKGGVDKDGKPKGILIQSRLLAMHLKRIKDECNSTDSDPVLPEHNSLDSITGHLFALTLTDEGPNPTSVPSKLWNSRAEFQETGPSSDVVARPPSLLPVTDITSSLNRLALATSTPSHCNQSLSLPSPSACPVSAVDGHSSPDPKKSSDRRTAQALRVLDNIESRIQRCSRLLLDPSESNHWDIRHELVVLRQSIEKITRRADIVIARKQRLSTMLDGVERHVFTVKDGSFQGPVDIDTENHYQPPIERMDITAQVALLLGVVCSVIFGAGTSMANFIMGGLSLLLFLAFQKPDGTLSQVQ